MEKNFDRLTESALIEAASRRAEKEMAGTQVDLNDFKGVPGYGDEEIQEDIKEIERLSKIFESKDKNDPEHQEARNLGKILEAIINEQVELGDWLGEGVLTIKTSKFDDYTRGVDEVAEFLEEGEEVSHLALAIDATIGGDSVVKLRRIKDEIEGGKLGEIKYFHSERTGFRGRLPGVPRAVITVDGGTIGALADLWMKGDQKNLNNHPVQFQILQEVILQAETFRAYAEGRGNKEAAQIYGDLVGRMRSVYEEKVREAGFRVGDFDSAFSALKFNLKIFED